MRTRTGEILGPYTQRELLEELSKRTFTPEDEIAPSHGYWISAQTLTNREVDEFTLTHTRNQTMTRSVHTSPNAAVLTNAEIAKALAGGDELTPTPDSGPSPVYPPQPAPVRPPVGARPAAKIPRGVTPYVVAAAAGAALLVLVVTKLRGPNAAVTPKETAQVPSSASLPPHASEGDTPFVRQVYGMIHSGQNAAALKKLAEYHEHHPNKGDVEYLIPYAALLITEGESPVRARRILESVIANTTVTAQLKARAHHWLGYLMLSQDEGDMGESHFLEALQLNASDAAARFNLGRAYLKQEKFPQALDYLQLAELVVPDLWLVHIYKGRAKAALGNMNEARLAFKKAMDDSQDRWITYIYYAIFLRGMGDADTAQSILRKMLTRDPHYEIYTPPPWGFYQEKVNYAEYLNAFSSMMDKANAEEKEVGRLYIAYLLNGASSNEGKRLEAAAITGGTLSKVLALQAALEREAPLEDLKVAVNRLPANLSDFGYYAYVLRGMGRARLGQYNEAQADYTRALTLEPRAASAHFQMASLLRKTSHTSEAESEIRSLLGFHPDYIPAIVPSQNYY